MPAPEDPEMSDEEYIVELEAAIVEAYDALEEGDVEKAKEILVVYVEEDAEPE